MEIFLGGAAGLLAVGLTIFVLIAARRGVQLQQLKAELSQAGRRQKEAEQRFEDKVRAVEEAHGKLSQLKGEVKQARKKAYLLEQKDKEEGPEPEPEADRLQELALQEARSEARRSGEEAARAAEECARLRGRVEKLEAELQDVRARTAASQNQAEGQKKEEREKLKKLESENRDLKKKLESCRRKARTDDQVYKVTKSKLDLAMEKIAALEKVIQARTASGPDS